MFPWQEQYRTRSLRSLVRYCSCHSNIKFISSRYRVISSIYITVNPNRTVSLSKFSFFKLLHLLIRSYQVPIVLICPLALSHFLKFKVLSPNPLPITFYFSPPRVPVLHKLLVLSKRKPLLQRVYDFQETRDKNK